MVHVYVIVRDSPITADISALFSNGSALSLYGSYEHLAKSVLDLKFGGVKVVNRTQLMLNYVSSVAIAYFAFTTALVGKTNYSVLLIVDDFNVLAVST